jgi:hypothetical protein
MLFEKTKIQILILTIVFWLYVDHTMIVCLENMNNNNNNLK